MSAELGYETTVQRILDILMADDVLAGKIATWRFGDVPDDMAIESPPAIYVTLPGGIERGRPMMGPALSDDVMPAQEVTIEADIVILVGGKSKSEDTQREMYGIRDDVVRILKRNVHLKDVNGNYPLAHTIDFSSIERLSSGRGETADGMVVVLDILTYLDSPQ